MALRRAAVIAGALAAAVADGALLGRILAPDGFSAAEAVTLALSVVLSAWVGFGFMSALAGFFAALGDRDTDPGARPAPQGRTAILMPTYNEDPGLVLSALEAMAEDLARLGMERLYDLFVLSDTRDEAIASAEAVGVLRMRLRLEGGPRVFYRRRPKNIDRKAGNIADWVQAHGGAYAYMLVLDADSLMAAATVAALTSPRDAEPGLGLLQSVPTIINARTPFARLQQFAARVYGPVYARGQQWWSGAEGNYWGHNAIIRVAAFAESAGLPHLSGPRPFGGHVMSHDFVEAALLRRRGWAVRTAATLGGSYEETPPTLLDTAARDRRWCQGNLQHVRLLGAAGLHWVSRLHLALGVFAYLAPALWLALLVFSGLAWPAERLSQGSPERAEAVALLALNLGLLATPKVLALALALRSPKSRAGFGGAGRLVAGFAAESVVSLLTAPVMMLMQSVAVADVLLGRDSGWAAQRREGAELSRRDAWRAHGGHVLLGVFGALAALVLSRSFLLWASPVFLSLTLSAALSARTSRQGPVRTGEARLLQIPEEREPPPVLVRALALRQAYAAEAKTRRTIAAMLREPVMAYDLAGAAAFAAAPRVSLAA